LSSATTSNIDPAVTWSKEFCKEFKPQVEYFLKFGNPIEKALFAKVAELAGVDV